MVVKWMRAALVCSTAITLVACERPVVFDDDIAAVARRAGSDLSAFDQTLPPGTSRAQVHAELLDFAASTLANSPAIASAQYRLEAAKSHVEEQRSNFDAQASFTVDGKITEQAILTSSNPSVAGNQSYYSTLDASLTVRQTIIDLSAAADIQRARAEVTARAAEYSLAQQGVLDTVLSRYLDGAEALERVTLAEAEIFYYRVLNRAEQQRVSAGDLRQSQRGDTLSELARAQSDYGTAVADYRIRVEALCRMDPTAACPLPRVISLNSPLPRPIPLNEAERAAVLTAPEQRALTASLSAALREVDRARLQRTPVLSGYFESSRRDRGGSLFDGSSVSRTNDVGLLLEWPIFQGNRVPNVTNRELNEAYALDAEREARLREQVGELEAAEAALKALWRNDAAMQSVVAARSRAERAYREELRSGAATDVEVARAKLEVVQAEVIRRTTRRTYLSATLARYRATGTIDARMVTLFENLLSNGSLAQRVYQSSDSL